MLTVPISSPLPCSEAQTEILGAERRRGILERCLFPASQAGMTWAGLAKSPFLSQRRLGMVLSTWFKQGLISTESCSLARC